MTTAALARAEVVVVGIAGVDGEPRSAAVIDAVRSSGIGADGVPLTDAERDELIRLRAENAFLRVQRDVLTRIATGYAHDVEVLLGRRATGVPHHPAGR